MMPTAKSPGINDARTPTGYSPCGPPGEKFGEKVTTRAQMWETLRCKGGVWLFKQCHFSLAMYHKRDLDDRDRMVWRIRILGLSLP